MAKTVVARPYSEMPKKAQQAHQLYLKLSELVRGRDPDEAISAVWSLLLTLSIENARSLDQAKNNLEFAIGEMRNLIEVAWNSRLMDSARGTA
jgi:hypothetical protein